MVKTVTEYVRSCQICCEAKNPPRQKRHRLQTYLVGGKFERIGMDLAGPYPKSRRNNSYILVISDYFTKVTELFALPDIKASTVADFLFRGWIKRYGCPRQIFSDHGRQFESGRF